MGLVFTFKEVSKVFIWKKWRPSVFGGNTRDFWKNTSDFQVDTPIVYSYF